MPYDQDDCKRRPEAATTAIARTNRVVYDSSLFQTFNDCV